jgi:hypothetical protein
VTFVDRLPTPYSLLPTPYYIINHGYSFDRHSKRQSCPAKAGG